MRFLKLAKRCLIFLCIFLVVYFIVFTRIQHNIFSEPKGRASDYTSSVRVVCMVLTSEENLLTRGLAVYDTWGKRLRSSGDNGLVFACNCTNVIRLKELKQRQLEGGDYEDQAVPDDLKKYLSVVDLPILHLDVVERKTRMGLKVIAVLNATYELYRNQAGKSLFWYMVDDDTYVFVENLIRFLETKNTNESFMYGFKRIGRRSGDFVYGGSGIVLTNTSMRLLVEKIRKDGCKRYIHGYGDWTIGKCAKAIKLKIGSTNDEYGLPRFHAYTPQIHFYGPLPPKVWRLGTHNRKIGVECCSLSSISFHYIQPQLMYEIDSNREFLRDFLTGNRTFDSSTKPASNQTNSVVT